MAQGDLSLETAAAMMHAQVVEAGGLADWTLEETDTGEPFVVFTNLETGEGCSLARHAGLWVIHCNRIDKAVFAAPTLGELVREFRPIETGSRLAGLRARHDSRHGGSHAVVQAEGREEPLLVC
jgi:hypothetical protein